MAPRLCYATPDGRQRSVKFEAGAGKLDIVRRRVSPAGLLLCIKDSKQGAAADGDACGRGHEQRRAKYDERHQPYMQSAVFHVALVVPSSTRAAQKPTPNTLRSAPTDVGSARTGS